MKFDMNIKNIRNIKINCWIFKIHTRKKDIYEKFEIFFSKLVWKETLFELEQVTSTRPLILQSFSLG